MPMKPSAILLLLLSLQLKILQQLHCRYELGFRPEALDGNRHQLRVELAAAGKNQHKGVRLRSRAAYVPVAFR